MVFKFLITSFDVSAFLINKLFVGTFLVIVILGFVLIEVLHSDARSFIAYGFGFAVSEGHFFFVCFVARSV